MGSSSTFTGQWVHELVAWAAAAGWDVTPPATPASSPQSHPHQFRPRRMAYLEASTAADREMNRLASLSTRQSVLRASAFILFILPVFSSKRCALGTLVFHSNPQRLQCWYFLPKPPTSKPHLVHLRGYNLEPCLSVLGPFRYCAVIYSCGSRITSVHSGFKQPSFYCPWFCVSGIQAGLNGTACLCFLWGWPDSFMQLYSSVSWAGLGWRIQNGPSAGCLLEHIGSPTCGLSSRDLHMVSHPPGPLSPAGQPGLFKVVLQNSES